MIFVKPVPKQADIKANLHYNPLTGVFTRIAGKWTGIIAGHYSSAGVRIELLGKAFPAHRLAWVYMYGDVLSPEMFIDHRDRDHHNNRISNLRIATISDNNANTISRRPHLPKGVSLRAGRYKSRITLDYKEFYLGTFDTAEEAGAAYVSAAARARGEFARG